MTAFIPDPVEKTTGTSAAEGVAADAMGNIYGAEVGPETDDEVREELSGFVPGVKRQPLCRTCQCRLASWSNFQQ